MTPVRRPVKKCPHGGGGISAVTAAARPSACMGDSSTRAATAAAYPCVSTGNSGYTAATAAILCVKSRTVLGKTTRFRGAVTKSKELEVHQALRDAQITFEYQHYLPFRGCGLESETAHAFADFALPTPWGYVLLEVDEEQHKAYDPSCDMRRDFDMAASVALGSGHKLLVLRYNPDAFKIAGVTRQTTKKERHAQLIRLLGELLAREPEAPFTRLFLFYDRAAENNALPCVAEHWSEPVRAVSRCA